MNKFQGWLPAYIMLINIGSFLTVGFDKRQAKAKAWRVPEKRFFFLSLIGGAIGTYAGMKAFRHKTKHPAFTIGIPLLIILNMIMFYFLLFRQ